MVKMIWRIVNTVQIPNNIKELGVAPIYIGAGLFVHTAQGLSHRPVSTAIPNAIVF
jgi:hypothetical protein